MHVRGASPALPAGMRLDVARICRGESRDLIMGIKLKWLRELQRLRRRYHWLIYTTTNLRIQLLTILKSAHYLGIMYNLQELILKSTNEQDWAYCHN
jgi:hypothetical protein